MSELSATNCGCGNSMDKYVLQDKYEIRNEWQKSLLEICPMK